MPPPTGLPAAGLWGEGGRETGRLLHPLPAGRREGIYEGGCPRGARSRAPAYRSVTLFSTAAATCCSRYPSCIFWAVLSSSRAVMI